MNQCLQKLSLLSFTLTLSCALPAQATPANKAALVRHFDRFLSKNLQSCTTCHLPSDKKDPESLEDFPHNPFGAALKKAGAQLRSEGKTREISARLELIASQDSDGDGVDNLSELLLGHNPGDAKDKPSPHELEQLPARREAYAAFLKSYRWEPYQPVHQPPVPAIAADWAKNPIDAFIAEQQQSQDLSPAPTAPNDTLLRRVYLDLIGLNPTPDEIAAYESDTSPNAYEKVVDHLLADPRYGQRWARHWMDIWRYSDWAGWSDGNQIRDSQPHIWRWRDWIVDSLNADKGYDRMLVEMLAADEVSPNDDNALRATGFLVRNYKMLSREQWLEDTVNHTSRAFLGLTMHCAKCHDHKFDPITQEEYYQLRAIFEPHDVRIDPVAGQPDKKLDGLCRTYDKELKAQTLFYIRGDERTPDKTRSPMTPGVPAALGGSLQINPISLSFRAAHPDRTDVMRKSLRAASTKTLEAAKQKYIPIKDNEKLPANQRIAAEAALTVAQSTHQALIAVLATEELEDAGKKGAPEWKTAATTALTAQRTLAVSQASQTLITLQNTITDLQSKRDTATTKPTPTDKLTTDLKSAKEKLDPAQKELAKAVSALNDPPQTTFKPRSTDDYPDTSTGRRLAFANWLTNAKNPLTARVAVNHLWARHFTQGLVPSVDDFGHNGRPATHPALVDWLASQLIASNWQMKPIHRLIVTSATYRQSSISSLTTQHSAQNADPDNTYLWHFPSKRMEAELVRDNVLYAAGQLDLSMNGPEIDNAQGLTSKRRSLYLRIAPEKEVEFLKIFDGPNPNECYLRRPSVMPQQALALANSQLVTTQARLLAKQLESQTQTDPTTFIQAAFLQILARHATADELAACQAFLTDPKTRPDRACENLVTILFNHNDFVTVR